MRQLHIEHFRTLVAKDRAINQFGPQIQQWPENTWWAVISSIKDQIHDAELPDLMIQYGVKQLVETPEYVEVVRS